MVGLGALLVLAAAGTAAGLRWERRDVTVATADGTIRLRVPHDWARQVRRSGWDLGPYGEAGRSGIALAASPDVTRWTDPTTDVPGVFAGRADGVAPAALLARSVAASCPAAPSRPLTGSGLSGTLTLPAVRRLPDGLRGGGAATARPRVHRLCPGQGAGRGHTADAVVHSLAVAAAGSG